MIELVATFALCAQNAAPVDARLLRRGLHYEAWTDPREGAFSVELPRGWRIDGGIVRPSPAQCRGRVSAASPDGAVGIYLGNADFPIYLEPSDYTAMLGHSEGSTMTTQDGGSLTVMRYLGAQEYIRRVILPGLQVPAEIETLRDRADIARAFPASWAMSYDAADAVYTFRRDERTFRAYVLVVLERGAVGGTAVWTPWTVLAGAAPEGSFDLAAQALAHAAGTVRYNERWLAAQNNLEADISRVISRTHSEVSSIIQSTYEERAASQDRIARERERVTLGVEDMVDPQTGDVYRVPNRYPHYWIGPNEQVVGTDTETSPGLEFRPMERSEP